MKKEPSMNEFLLVFDDIFGVKTLPTFGQIFGQLAIFLGKLEKVEERKVEKCRKIAKLAKKSGQLAIFLDKSGHNFFFQE